MKRTVLPYETSLDDAYRHFGDEFYVLQIGDWLSYWDCIVKAVDYYLDKYRGQPYDLYKFTRIDTEWIIVILDITS